MSKSQLPAYRLLDEPELAFHPERAEDRHRHPLVGLVNYGPYSRALIASVVDPIRIAIIAPGKMLRRVDVLLAEMEHLHQPRERRNYLVEYPGFSRVFGVRAVSASSACRIEMPDSLDDDIARSERPHLVLAQGVVAALSALQVHRSDFDIVFVLLPTKWKQCFFGGQHEDFDLHDYLKAVAAVRGIPLQILNEDQSLVYPCRASVMWRLGIATYCKAGGVPWKIANADPEAAYIGLSYAVRPASAEAPRFVTCCSQVFDSDGAGLEFLLYETAEAHIERDNPFLSRTEMRRVMSRSLSLYQRRHAGRVPRRVVVHKSTEFKSDEIDGCFDAWRSAEGMELIQVQQDTLWRGIQMVPARNGKPEPDSYPCHRGCYVTIGSRDVLLWTQGNAPSAALGKGNFYKEGKGIPSPLLLVRHAGHGGWDEGCRAVLQLTKMNWNNDSLYDRLPVTLGYAQVLARTVKRMPTLAAKPYEFRLFM